MARASTATDLRNSRRPGPAGDWGVTTQKENQIYVHVLTWGSPLLALPPIEGKISSAHLLLGGDPVEVTQAADGVILNLRARSKDETDHVIVLTMSKNP